MSVYFLLLAVSRAPHGSSRICVLRLELCVYVLFLLHAFIHVFSYLPFLRLHEK